ncbi:MAG: hypothetical protein ACHQFW_06705, partial [Chitinophagales bacterium]
MKNFYCIYILLSFLPLSLFSQTQTDELVSISGKHLGWLYSTQADTLGNYYLLCGKLNPTDPNIPYKAVDSLYIIKYDSENIVQWISIFSDTISSSSTLILN